MKTLIEIFLSQKKIRNPSKLERYTNVIILNGHPSSDENTNRNFSLVKKKVRNPSKLERYTNVIILNGHPSSDENVKVIIQDILALNTNLFKK